jgi:hypothetical protein
MKLLKVLVAALLLAAMVTPAIAEDRLSLSGEMRTRGFYTDYQDNNYTTTWADQRLRIAGKIAVAEGVSVTFRTDITEGTNWGDSSNFNSTTGNPERTNGAGSARSGSQQQWDRAHLDVTKGMFHLRAGQQYVGTGGTFAVDTQDNGLLVDVKAGVPVTAYVIVDNNNNVPAQDAYIIDQTTGLVIANPNAGPAQTNNSDAFLWGLTATPKIGDVATKFFYAGYNDGSYANVSLFGASASMNIEAIKLFGEFDYFTGDATTKNQDAMGTQLFLDGSMAATDALSFGGQVYYAAGDSSDKQYTGLGNGFNGWDPLMDVGTSLSNEALAIWTGPATRYSRGTATMDFSGLSQGVVGGRLYGNFMVNDALSFGLSGAYLTVEDDHTTDDTLTAFAAGMVYKFAENTSFQLQLQQSEYDYDPNNGSSDSEDIFQAATGLYVTF